MDLHSWTSLENVNISPLSLIDHDYIPTNVIAIQSDDPNLNSENNNLISLQPLEFENESLDSLIDLQSLNAIQEIIEPNNDANYLAALEAMERNEINQEADTTVDETQENETSGSGLPPDLENISDEELLALSSPDDAGPTPSVQQLYELFGWQEEEIQFDQNAGPPELLRDPRDIPAEEKIYRILFMLPNGYSSPAFVPGNIRYDGLINYLRTTVLSNEDWKNLICELRCLDPPGRNLGKLPRSWTLAKTGLPNRIIVQIILKHV